MNFVLAASMIALAACGGGDSSSGGNPPTSAPTTTPTPTPTPSPSPTPTPTYSLPDYTSDFTVRSSLAYFVNFIPDPSLPVSRNDQFVSGALVDGESTVLTYRHSPELVTLQYGTASTSFTGAERVANPPSVEFARQTLPSGRLLLRWATDPNLPKYVSIVYWRFEKGILTGPSTISPGLEYGSAIFGTPSATSDPLPAFLGYAGVPMLYGGTPGQPPQRQHAGTQTMYWSYTPSSDVLSGHIQLYADDENNAAILKGQLTANGTFDRATNTISGTLTDASHGLEGTFRGQMFGPDRAELAIVFQFSRASDGSAWFGHYVGKR